MPTNRIFVDTSYIVALINERDQHHDKAVKLADQYNRNPLVITDVILLEIANVLAREYKFESVQVIEEFLASEDVEVIRLTTDLFNQAFELYKTRQDKSWGLVDCISFIVMSDRSIQLALTFDQHFMQAGFQALPLIEQ